MFVQDQILQFLRITGPTLPSKVARQIKTEIYIASAHLSDLAAQGKVKISYLKVGGSPLYYLPGQEEKLYYFAAGNLNPKDYQVLEVLKDRKVLRENGLELLSKVALRSLKDFAIPLHVTYEGNTELFWKWYLLTEEEAKKVIMDLFSAEKKTLPAEPEQQVQEMEQKEESQQINTAGKAEENRVQEIFPGCNLQKYFEDEKESQSAAEIKKLPEKKERKNKKEIINDSEDFEAAEEIKARKKPCKSQKVKSPEKAAESKKKEFASDELAQMTEEFFKDRNIVIEQAEMIRKNSEIDYLIKVPSVVGSLVYFCKVKNKSRCDEKDLSSAYMEAQIKKLPLLFLYRKEISKKAQEMLDSGAFQNAVLKKME